MSTSVSRAYQFAGTLFTALAVLLGFWYTRLRWAHQVDFDVTGVLWLLQNIGPLSALVLTLICTGVALYCWIRAAAAR
jgi:hypothetical protein